MILLKILQTNNKYLIPVSKVGTVPVGRNIMTPNYKLQGVRPPERE